MKKSYLVACLLMILGISVRTVAQTNPGTVNLKHQWTFDDGTANDNVGGVNGTLMSGATVSNNALNTTNGGWVNLDATALAINTYSELTVEAWFTSVAGANTGYHFLYYLGNTTNGGGDHFTGFTPARGDDRSRLMLSAGGSEAAINSTEFDDGRLHHMVCVINSTTLYYYIDGILLATKSIGTNTLANVGNQFAYFAKGGWTSDPTWKGTIDQISVYDKALTADNVKYLYDQHKENITPADPGIANLTHQWTFDDGTATDIVGGVNGVLNGSATVSGKALNTTNGGYVNLDAAALAVNTYSQLTVEAWFTSSTGANTGYHFLYYFGNTTNNNGNHFTGFTPARGNDFSRTMIDTGDGEKGINCTEFDDGRLHHIVCVIDATTLTYYIDGIFVGTVNIGASSLANVSAQFAYFAKGGWSNDPTWKGMIHKISMYNKALMINNVKYLYSMGPEQTPSITSSASGFAFDPNFSQQTMNVSSLNLSSNIQITAPAGVTVTPSTIAANTSDNTVTVTYDKSSVVNGNIVLTSGTTVVNIPVKSASELCYTKLYGDKENLISDYGCNGLSSFSGWGTKEIQNIITNPENVYCGASSIAVGDGTNVDGNGSGSLNYSLTGKIKPSSTYRVRAMIKTINGGFQIGIAGWDNGASDKNFPIETSGEWQPLDFTFTTGANPASSPVMFLNNWHCTGTKAFIDNWEMYEVPSITTDIDRVEKMIRNVFVSNNQIIAEFESATEASSRIDVYNIQGALLSSEVFTCNAGVNNKIIKAEYPAGIYLVRLTVAGQTSYAKVVK